MTRPAVLPSADPKASAPEIGFFAAPWLAYALPCRRFIGALADTDARLGADVGRYSFIVMDLHHLLLAGLPAHWGYPILGIATAIKPVTYSMLISPEPAG